MIFFIAICKKLLIQSNTFDPTIFTTLNIYVANISNFKINCMKNDVTLFKAKQRILDHGLHVGVYIIINEF